ncbi:uncharacterized protein LY79DRAFT_544215 [Colletotrichum navitas]|uniref:Uncharacterized protein n=1 Tax=Colletotrichum navitas TaxID=681940 RepID=A0AAD8Q5H9_9PEZI|nr:uncharacterized protein LY79DRAFT_544215 [Colletotrichum navitas]KAK1596265.1 hypothetical protein LY79DRAFT_544215 [Colletotrichum navitas]
MPRKLGGCQWSRDQVVWVPSSTHSITELGWTPDLACHIGQPPPWKATERLRYLSIFLCRESRGARPLYHSGYTVQTTKYGACNVLWNLQHGVPCSLGCCHAISAIRLRSVKECSAYVAKFLLNQPCRVATDRGFTSVDCAVVGVVYLSRRDRLIADKVYVPTPSLLV